MARRLLVGGCAVHGVIEVVAPFLVDQSQIGPCGDASQVVSDRESPLIAQGHLLPYSILVFSGFIFFRL